MTIAEVGIESADVASMRERQPRLLLDIEALTAEIRRASPTTMEDIVALLDLVLEHETDLVCDIANDGPIDYPMTVQLLRAAARLVPVSNLTRLGGGSRPPQFEELFPCAVDVAGPAECLGFGEPDKSS
jgi:hypothetical protein